MNYEANFLPLHKQTIARAQQHKTIFIQAFLSVPQYLVVKPACLNAASFKT